MAKKKKKKDDELVEFIGEEISMETAILASALTLFEAGQLGTESRDPDVLIRVANGWYDIAKFLYTEETEEKRQQLEFGFQPGGQDDDGVSSTTSESIDEVCEESGKLRKPTPRVKYGR